MRAIRPVSLLMLSLLALAGCNKPAEQAAAPAAASGEQVIKLGHASPMTGPIAHIGKDTEYGAQIAVDELNGEGFTLGGKPVKFQLVSEDDQGDPKMATQIAQRMVDAKIAGMIGHLNSGTTIPASKIYADANIGQITPSATNPAFTQQGFKTTFRLIADDVQQGKALADFAVNTLKAKKIAIIDDRSAYGQGLADEFDKAAKVKGVTVGRVPYADFGLDVYGSGFATRDALIEKEPETVRAFLKAAYRGYADAARDPKAALAIIRKYYPLLDEAVTERQIRETAALMAAEGGSHRLKPEKAERICRNFFKIHMFLCCRSQKNHPLNKK